ncbi:histidinol-phosphatase [Kurthia zopfii]|uniref:Histidinol-phosphatase n=1 Tax=Kurthia zopfii TaxID=1650 RepID=A0A8B4QC36_9BACL|nr:histidinol-phosphatase HisJ [Kurthia zopfii]PWI23107.1 histidinol-phosphatase [Kurthia zopfii]TDR40572.1 histidinol-phosphate phosphatase [Kurthia zopfii]GEK30131.1 histidinol-phosphatase [Kurthia zopfii]STX10311.1 Histidinol-phosphatase [Kurthia zopfii]
MKRDAHIHSPYCPHGSNDGFELYIEKAISEGIQDITFTEHAPLPRGFIDPTPLQDSGMRQADVLPYIQEITLLKEKYANQIKIRVGFEVDFIEGFEQQTCTWLNEFGPLIDDAILSVHFLKYANEYVCIDYSKDVFLEFSKKVGSVEQVYQLYYETVRQSIEADLGMYKPMRIGHPTLVHKFRLAHNENIDDHQQIIEILHCIKEHDYELDVNSAGYAKAFCQESYPPIPYIPISKNLQVKLIFGSDAHQAKDLHQFAEKLVHLS